jgi:hypothetical protein
MLVESTADTMALVGTSDKSEIFDFSAGEIGRSERHTIASGWIPMLRSYLTECCVGLVFSSSAGPMYGTSVTWM